MSFTKENSLKAKGIGILLLIFHHLFFYKPRFEAYKVVPWVLTVDQLVHVATAARVCVWIFVFVSAYGIETHYQKRVRGGRTLAFVFERWFSLMKGYWFIYLLALAVVLATGFKSLSFYENNILYLLLDWAGLADLFGTPTLSGAWWYMCYAQVLLFLTPLFSEFCKKFGWVSFLVMLILLQYLPDGITSSNGGSYNMYLCGQILGVLCAQNDFFRIFRQTKGVLNNAGWYIALFVSVAVLVEFRFWLVSEEFGYNYRNLNWIVYGIAAMLICAMTVVVEWKLGDAVLKFFGRHSGNMFFIHMFFVYYLADVVFFTKTVAGSWLTLVILSLLTSLAVNLVKKWSHYDVWMGKLSDILGKN